LSNSVATLDTDVLGPYLDANVSGFSGLVSVEKFADGQSNPTFRVKAHSGEYVLRRQPPGDLLKSAHAVDREYRVLAALASTDVPVPKVYHLCEDRDVIGSMFYVMEFCDGRIFWNAAIPEVGKMERTLIYDETNRVLATLHQIDIEAVGLSDFGKPGSYFERQYDRWSGQYRASELRRIDAMETLMSWLGDNLPDDDGRVSLVHGDYRLDNMIFDASGNRKSLRCSTGSCRLLDIHSPMLVINACNSECRHRSGASPGCVEETLASWVFQQRMNMWRSIANAPVSIELTAIVQGVAKRAVDGNASSRKAAEMGQYVEPMAELALEAIQQGDGVD